MSDYFYSLEMLTDWQNFFGIYQRHLMRFAAGVADEENQ